MERPILEGPLVSGLRRALVLVAVAVAFADASIVVLAVPEIVSELDVGVAGASWVITAYNVAVVVAGLGLVVAGARVRSPRWAAAGFAAFALASVGCALAPSYEPLVAFRALQGAAAALVLVASLSLLGRRGGVRGWTLAATVGLAAGPALGGLLTELFSWRSIFVAQAPLVALGLLALRRRGAQPGEEVEPAETAGRRTPRSWLADGTLAALSAALVGALFLVVVLLINGFGLQPLEAALVATTLPLVALLGERAGGALPPAPAAATGGLLVAAGLATLGLLPGERLDLVLAGLALCGAGLGLAAQPLGRLALGGGRLTRDAAWTVVARHAGLVAALVVVTPVLVSSLEELEEEAEAVGGDLVLRAPLPLETKVPLLVDLAQVADEAEAALPDLEETLEPYETGEGRVAALAAELTDALQDLVARSFRESFLICAGFGITAAVLALGLGLQPARVRPAAAAFAVVGVAAAALALAAAVRLGALDESVAAEDPCAAGPLFEGTTTDDRIQRIALAALASAACELETNRASLLRHLLEPGSQPWPEERLARALRSGALEAIDAERELGRLSGGVALLLSTVVANAPLDWIRDALRGLGSEP